MNHVTFSFYFNDELHLHFVVLTSGIQVQVEEVEETLEKTKAELGVLMSYKDKEYPVRAMRISELQHQIEFLTVEFEVCT